MSTTAVVTAQQGISSNSGSTNKLRRADESKNLNVDPTERLISVGLGSGALAWGLAGDKVSPLCLVAGAFLLYRGATGHCPLRSAIGNGGDGSSDRAAVIPAREGIRIEHQVVVNRPPAQVYEFWRNLSQLPQIMSHLKEVREEGSRSHWVARGPLNVPIEWDAELITDTRNETIGWRSLPGSQIDTAGSVHFSPINGGNSTEVRVNLKFRPPAGQAGVLLARLVGGNPQSQMENDLNEFKKKMESGATATSR